jgi:ABC-type phosphate/phosphonate transport system substrate-binding protein
VTLLPFDSDLGKHGDSGQSELEVLEAVSSGQAQAGVVGDWVWVAEQAAGRVPVGEIEARWTTPAFDHCMFDARVDLAPEVAAAFQRALFAMRWEEPSHRRIMELEGLRRWLPPREDGYASLERALAEQNGW